MKLRERFKEYVMWSIIMEPMHWKHGRLETEKDLSEISRSVVVAKNEKIPWK